MRTLRLIVLAVCMLGLASPTLAQERDPDMEAALERLEEARDQLDAALRQLRASDSRDARRQLERAMVGLREAERALRTGRGGAFTYFGPGGRFEVFGPEDMPGVVMFDSDRPKIGVIVETDPAEGEGAVLAAVTPGGPAAEAGLKAGDVVISVDGKIVSGTGAGDHFVAFVREAEEGDTLRIEYLRDGDTHTVEVAPRPLDALNTWAYSFGDLSGRLEGIGERLEGLGEQFEGRVWSTPGIEMRGPGEFATTIVSRLRTRAFSDLELVTVNPDLASYFGTDEGVLVVKSSERSDLPLKGGDVILSIDGRAPRNPAHAMRILGSYEAGETISMEIMRDKRRQTVTMDMPDHERR